MYGLTECIINKQTNKQTCAHVTVGEAAAVRNLFQNNINLPMA
jgi:hypothetical protein